MKYIFALLFLSLTIQGCENKVLRENRNLSEEVMAIHDEAMARMTQMHELRLKLQELEKTDGPSSERSGAIDDLQNAHNMMMGWMRQYKAPRTDDELEHAGPYLSDQKIKIQKVHTAINESIGQAEKLLKTDV